MELNQYFITFFNSIQKKLSRYTENKTVNYFLKA